MQVKVALLNTMAHKNDETKAATSEFLGIEDSHKLYERTVAFMYEEIKRLKEERKAIEDKKDIKEWWKK